MLISHGVRPRDESPITFCPRLVSNDAVFLKSRALFELRAATSGDLTSTFDHRVGFAAQPPWLGGLGTRHV